MSDTTFRFPHYARMTRELLAELRRATGGSDDEKIRALLDDLPSFGDGRDGHDKPLTLAFAGLYDAGKSTIIKALTGRDDIPIAQDVCTNRVTAYDWSGVLLLDTPGIHAGYPDHDALTYREIDRADLVVFTITNELFGEQGGAHFRQLAFGRNKAGEMLLVVNKMGQDPGTPAIKRPDIEAVTSPLSAEDFRTVFIDARSYLEALKTDDEEDKEELFEIANLRGLTAALDAFIGDKGLAARLTTPLFTLRSVAEQARAYSSVDLPEERAALELLHRKRRILFDSRARLLSRAEGLVGVATADIVGHGDAVAESVEPGVSEEQLRVRHASAQRQAEVRCSDLAAAMEGAAAEELGRLQRELAELDRSLLAAELRGSIDSAIVRATSDPGLPRVDWSAAGARTPDEVAARLKKVGDVTKNLGAHASAWATGPFATTARAGSLGAARGSSAHGVVYSVGKFFGVKFRPWGAVKVARAIGTVGKVLGAVGGVLGLIAQISEEKQQDELRRGLQRYREDIRAAYREAARSVDADFWTRFEDLSRFYDEELVAVDATATDMIDVRDGRARAADAYGSIASRASALIEEIQGDARVTGEGRMPRS